MEQERPKLLSDFDVSPERGFLPAEDPLTELPHPLEFLDYYGDHLPELIESKEILNIARALPIIPEEYFLSLKLGKRELQLAWVRISHLLSGYVHSLVGPKVVPPNLAKLACMIAKELGIKKPILQYSPYVLYNWKRKNPEGPIKVDNLELIQMFLRIPEQAWFNLTHTDIENEAGPAIRYMWALNKPRDLDNVKVETSLVGIYGSIENMIVVMMRMPEGTYPDTYYKIRPWIWSFENVIYEGIDEYGGQLQNFRGQTGAQTSIFQALEAGLQMPRLSDNSLSRHLYDMRNYMPAKHREFIEYLERNSRVREFVISSVPSLMDLYDSCLFNILKFLAIHLGYAFFYIHQKTENPRGTGNTDDFMKYLGERIGERWRVAFIKPRSEEDLKIFLDDMRKTVKELVAV